jgi:hypothetical protein
MIAVGMSVFYQCCYCRYYCCFEVFIHKLTGNQVLNEQIPLIVMGGMVLILMILITTSILLNLEQSMTKQGPSYPLVLFYYSLGHYYFIFFWNLLSNSLSTINFMVLLGLY